MQQKRDKNGRFMPSGATKKERLPFNQRYVKAHDTVKSVDNNAVREAYEAGFNAAKRAGAKMSVKECFAGFLQYEQ